MFLVRYSNIQLYGRAVLSVVKYFIALLLNMQIIIIRHLIQFSHHGFDLTQ